MAFDFFSFLVFNYNQKRQIRRNGFMHQTRIPDFSPTYVKKPIPYFELFSAFFEFHRLHFQYIFLLRVLGFQYYL